MERNIHKMRLVDFAFNAIKNGEKDIEIRLNDEKRQLIKIGDIIEFEHIDTKEIIKVRVVNLHLFNTFKELINNFDKHRLGLNKDDDEKICDNFYTKEEQTKYQALGIEIKLINNEEKIDFFCYPKCSTCKKARAWLDKNNIKYNERHIVLNNPSYDELKLLVSKYNVDIKRMFNTSGIKYRELNLKEKLSNMTIDEKLRLLASDGMLVKRPLLVENNALLIGFNETEWATKLLYS